MGRQLSQPGWRQQGSRGRTVLRLRRLIKEGGRQGLLDAAQGSRQLILVLLRAHRHLPQQRRCLQMGGRGRAEQQGRGGVGRGGQGWATVCTAPATSHTYMHMHQPSVPPPSAALLTSSRMPQWSSAVLPRLRATRHVTIAAQHSTAQHSTAHGRAGQHRAAGVRGEGCVSQPTSSRARNSMPAHWKHRPASDSSRNGPPGTGRSWQHRQLALTWQQVVNVGHQLQVGVAEQAANCAAGHKKGKNG